MQCMSAKHASNWMENWTEKFLQDDTLQHLILVEILLKEVDQQQLATSSDPVWVYLR